MRNPERIVVVAGVLECSGKFLIAQRKRGQRHELKWEFPGGKLENGESPEAGLARELKEELRIEGDVGPELARYELRDPESAPVLLIFLRVNGFRGRILDGFFEQLRWEERNNLHAFDFLEGDREFVRRLMAGDFEASFSESRRV